MVSSCRREAMPAWEAGAQTHDARDARDDRARLVLKGPDVRDLAAGLEIERRAIQRHEPPDCPPSSLHLLLLSSKSGQHRAPHAVVV